MKNQQVILTSTRVEAINALTVFLSVFHYACKVVIIGHGRESNAWKNL
jgi:hypothetical protein